MTLRWKMQLRNAIFPPHFRAGEHLIADGTTHELGPQSSLMSRLGGTAFSDGSFERPAHSSRRSRGVSIAQPTRRDIKLDSCEV